MQKISSLLRFIPPDIRSEDYAYELPESRIAAYPLSERDASKLLIADMRGGSTNTNMSGAIRHRHFHNIVEELPDSALLVMNDSRVIAARIEMNKLSGGRAEVLCLQPISIVPHESPNYIRAFQQEGSVQWCCMVGGRRIQAGDTLFLEMSLPSKQPRALRMEAVIMRKAGQEADIEFRWTPANMSFAECLAFVGHVPLPPYLKRSDEESDKERYQTVYAAHDGSVAAPTAGLHFTSRVLQELQAKGIRKERVTLHVGAGTFKPMTSEKIADHEMHEERIFVQRSTVAALAMQLERHEQTGDAPVVAVGTTSMRTLESLYWWALQCFSLTSTYELSVRQWDGFSGELDTRFEELPTPSQAMKRLLDWMQEHNLETLTGSTQIMIAPGYSFKICHGLITNFHQPQSTLMLLVAAFLQHSPSPSGTHSSAWRSVYEAALSNEYRFLSYGDSSLLWRAEPPRNKD
ncbi:MAG: S-adenosylmethionine:tRNA ribosyltransferase-isomerase [Candidatus Kapaibacterium sp.]|nr:MAG: S-adenosylmethionine:tRNA ribosyltransferase-isomerase [Candidatus Kapabacteria bacterium]